MDRRFPFYTWKVILLSDTPTTLVVVAGDDLRWCNGELCDALEDVLRRIGSKVRSQLVVNGEVRRKHEEVANVSVLKSMR